MTQLNCKSFAKLNLCLHVLNKRKDDYHNLESIFQTINLYDCLAFKKNNNKSINFTTDSKLINPLDNLITKAYKFISVESNKEIGVDIFLKKNIPIGAGLGGGSSNAAVTLIAINSLFNLNLSKNQLLKISQNIGSDVPFFIEGGAACVRGKGDVIESLVSSKKYFVLIFSDISISTQQIFQSLSPKYFSSNATNTDLSNSKYNCLEDTVFVKYPQLKDTKYWLSSFGSVRMSGTGSTLYIEYDDYESANKANKEIGRKYRSKIVSSLESYDIFS